MYKKTCDESTYDVYDQIFLDFQIIIPSIKVVTVCPYFTEDGSKVIYSYPGYNRLHPMFQNICAREKVIDFDDLPTQILVPHYYESQLDFLSIAIFVHERLQYMLKGPKDAANLQY
jgi:hypothetical protein